MDQKYTKKIAQMQEQHELVSSVENLVLGGQDLILGLEWDTKEDHFEKISSIHRMQLNVVNIQKGKHFTLIDLADYFHLNDFIGCRVTDYITAK